MRKRPPPRNARRRVGVAAIASFPGAVVRPVRGVGMTPESLTAAWSADERRRLDLAHVAVVLERSSGLVNVFGPFAGPVEASAFADRYTFEIADVVAGGTDVLVVPLDPDE